MARVLTSAMIVVTSLLFLDQAQAAECDWGSLEGTVITPSVPYGVSTVSKEIGIGQSIEVAESAAKREFSGAAISIREDVHDMNRECKLTFRSQMSVSSATSRGRGETLTAEFGSKKSGSQLLSLERHIGYGNDVQLPLVSEMVSELQLRFGEPSAVGKGLSESTRVYYFAYKDQQKIKIDVVGPNSCRVPASYYPPRIFDLAKNAAACDFIVHVFFDITQSTRGLAPTDPAYERYREVWIQYLDLKRARADAAARDSWIGRPPSSGPTRMLV
jgi:hypothetical protein